MDEQCEYIKTKGKTALDEYEGLPDGMAGFRERIDITIGGSHAGTSTEDLFEKLRYAKQIAGVSTIASSNLVSVLLALPCPTLTLPDSLTNLLPAYCLPADKRLPEKSGV